MDAKRMLFTCRPLAGHFEPLLPLAREATAAGHAVAFATGEPCATRAQEAGFEAFAAGPDEGFRDAWAPRFPGVERLVGNEQRRFFLTEIFANLELVSRTQRDVDGDAARVRCRRHGHVRQGHHRRPDAHDLDLEHGGVRRLQQRRHRQLVPRPRRHRDTASADFTGAISGTVTDGRAKSGLSGATVDCGVAGAATTGTNGTYAITNVAPSTYTCTASAAGYRSKSSPVTVNSGATTTANFALR